jgi:hypothetical protein
MMIAFDHMIKTEYRQIPAIEILPRHDFANLILENGSSVDINLMHAILSHANEETIKKTALCYNIKLTGMMTKCHHCALAKAMQKNFSKTSDGDKKANAIWRKVVYLYKFVEDNHLWR